MSIAVKCPACQTSFKVKDRFAGLKGRCPDCKAVVRVPGVAASKPSLASQPSEPLEPQTFDLTEPPAAPSRPSRQERPKVVPPVPPTLRRPKPAYPAPMAEDDAPPVAGLSPLDIGEDFSKPIASRPVLHRAPLGMASRSPGAQVSAGPGLQVPTWAWGVVAVVGILMVGGVSVVGVFALQNNNFAKPVASAPRPPQPTVVKSNPAPFNPEVGKTVALKNDKPQAGAPLEDIVDYVKHSIVKIETSDAFNRRTGLGSGFIIHAKGLVATNYHVVSDASKAEVVFSDGTRYGVEGYVALNPQTDLCILKLNGVPPNVRALQLVTGAGPRVASKVYAIGHPHDHEFTTTGGIVSSVVHTAQLPADTKAWLKGSLQGEPDNTWIHHDARISPGNSGGPLIDAAGDVLGVNSWINQETGLGFAIHSKHLQELVARESSTVTALKDKRRKREESPDEQLVRDSFDPQKLQKLAAELSAKHWQPAGEEDCASLDSLALGVTIIRMVQDGAGRGKIPESERAAMISVADQIIETLRKVKWQENEQIVPINAHANRPGPSRTGAFLFGVFKQRVDLGNRQRGWLIELKGSSKLYFIPSDENDPQFRDGDCALVLGIAVNEELPFGENRLKPIKAQILLTNVMLKVSDGPADSTPDPSPGPEFNDGPQPNRSPPAPRPGSRNRPGSRRPNSFPRGAN